MRRTRRRARSEGTARISFAPLLSSSAYTPDAAHPHVTTHTGERPHNGSAALGKEREQDADKPRDQSEVAPQLELPGLVLEVVPQRRSLGYRFHPREVRGAVEEPHDADEQEEGSERSHRCYSPVKRAGRFSRKAIVPSSLFFDSKVIAWAVDS